MTKTLVPIDGSEAVLRALRYEMQLADEIHVVNVKPKVEAPSMGNHLNQVDVDRIHLSRAGPRSLTPARCWLTLHVRMQEV